MKQLICGVVLSAIANSQQTKMSSSVVPEKVYTMEDFNTNLFWNRPAQGYFPVNVGLPGPETPDFNGERIAAIGDLNDDKWMDLVTCNEAGNQVTVHYYDEKTMKYSKSTTFAIDMAETEQIEGDNRSLRAENIVVAKEAKQLQGLLITVQDQALGKSYLQWYKQTKSADGGHSFAADMKNSLYGVQIYPDSQPMVLDINGDQVMDILFQSPSEGIKVAIGSNQQLGKYITKNFFQTFVVTNDPNCKTPTASDLLSMPNSNAFVDFDGDCMPDLLLTRQNGTQAQKNEDDITVSSYYEIYVQRQIKSTNGDLEQKYCLVSSQKGTVMASKNPLTGHDNNMPMIEVSDLNRDGMSDLSFVDPNTGSLVVLYNQYKAQTPSAETLCKATTSTKDLSEKPFYSNFPYSDSKESLVQELGFVFNPMLDGKAAFNGLQQSDPYNPGRIRIADINLDGFPDMVITASFLRNVTVHQHLADPTTEIEKISLTAVLLNSESDAEAGAVTKKSEFRINIPGTNSEANLLEQQQRAFRPVSKDSYYYKISQQAATTAELVTFIDIDEDGNLDCLIQKQTGGVPSLSVLYNNVETENFFIKALMVNQKQEASADNNMYGDTGVGVSYRFVVTDLEDYKYVFVGTQQPQSGYLSLQLPYTYMGIGRSNNYVETFFAATSIHAKKATHMWTPLIPNSQLVIFANSAETDGWSLELFINPTQSLYIIVIVCACLLVVLGIIIIGLHCKEKREDEANKDKTFEFM